MTVPECQKLCPFYMVCIEKNIGYLTKPCTERVDGIRKLVEHLTESQIERIRESENIKYDLAEALVKDLLGIETIIESTKWVNAMDEIDTLDCSCGAEMVKKNGFTCPKCGEHVNSIEKPKGLSLNNGGEE